MTVKFIGANSTLAEAKGVIYGMPMDWTASYRAGSRLGPARIRESSWVLEEYSPYLQAELSQISYYDAGDLTLPPGNAAASVQRIEQFVDELLNIEKVPFGLGGEHLVVWPIIKAFSRHFDNLTVIHIDAHADLRVSYEGEDLSHATPLRKVASLVDPNNLYQLGIRSMTKSEYRYARESGINFYPYEVIAPLSEILPKLAGRSVYLTLDIDVVDPAFAPGTGTPEPGGVTSSEILRAVHMIAQSDVKVVGVDLVEVAPIYDLSEQTPILASKLVREMLLGFL